MKKKTLSTIIVLILFTILMVSVFLGALEMAHAQSSDSNGDPNTWSMFRNNLSRTGISTSTAPTTNQILWSYTIGDTVISSPAIANGVVYADRASPDGSGRGSVFALNAATGSLLWSYSNVGDEESSSPADAKGGTVPAVQAPMELPPPGPASSRPAPARSD